MRPEIHCRPPPSDISFQIVPYFDEQSSRRTTDFSSSNIYSSGCVQLKFEASEGRKLKVLYLVVFRRLQRSFCPGSCMICFYEVPCSPLNQAGRSFLFFFFFVFGPLLMRFSARNGTAGQRRAFLIGALVDAGRLRISAAESVWCLITSLSKHSSKSRRHKGRVWR